MSDEVTTEERAEAKRLLGDVVGDTLDRVGISKLVKKVMPDCNCSGRRAKLNDFHRRLMGEDA